MQAGKRNFARSVPTNVDGHLRFLPDTDPRNKNIALTRSVDKPFAVRSESYANQKHMRQAVSIKRFKRSGRNRYGKGLFRQLSDDSAFPKPLHDTSLFRYGETRIGTASYSP